MVNLYKYIIILIIIYIKDSKINKKMIDFNNFDEN
jgi:hypothetical protein